MRENINIVLNKWMETRTKKKVQGKKIMDNVTSFKNKGVDKEGKFNSKTKMNLAYVHR